MRYQRLFLIYGVILVLCLAHALQADEYPPKDEGPTHSPSSSNGRPTAPLEIGIGMTELIKRYITPSEAYIKSRFSESLPSALEKSIRDNDEEGIAKDLSELFGQVNTEQAKTIYNEILKDTKATKSECGSKEAEDTKRLDALKTRMYWAVRYLLKIKDEVVPLCKTPENAFQAVFKTYWDKTKEQNDAFHKLLKLANDGDTSAIAEIKSKYDSNAILGFLENQNETGNTEVASNLAKVLSEKNGSGHYIDGLSSTGEQTRVALGTDPKNFSKVLKEIKADPSQNGISGLRYSSTPFEKPARYMVAPSLKETIKPAKPVDSVASGSAAPPPKKSAEGTPSIADKEIPTEAASALMNKCVSCHGPKGKQFATFPMSALGEVGIDANQNKIAKDSPAFKEKIQGVFDRAVVPGGGMPPEESPEPHPQLSPEEKNALKVWTVSLGASVQ